MVKSHDRERLLRLAIKRNAETVDAKIAEYKHRVMDSQLEVFRLTDSERFLQEEVEELQARLAECDAKFALEKQALESQSEVRIFFIDTFNVYSLNDTSRACFLGAKLIVEFVCPFLSHSVLLGMFLLYPYYFFVSASGFFLFRF